MLFLDVVTAFACMLRRSVFSIDDGDEFWLYQLKCAGFSDIDIKAIYDTVVSISSWDIDSRGNLISGQCGMTELSTKVAEQWYVNTWMSQEGIPGVFVSDAGCMAGTPLADLLFTVSISRVIHILRKSMVNDQLTSHVEINGNKHELCDVSFVDDTACPVTGSAGEIVQKTTDVARVAFGVFKCFNLDLNFLPGKSECVLSICGPGKKQTLRDMAKANNRSSFVVPNGRVVELLYVKTYKHVGTKTPFDAHMGEEVSTRCAMMRSGCFKLDRPVFCNTRIDMDKRLLIFQVYIVTKGTFQCATWSRMSASVYRKFHNCIMHTYRRITGHYFDNPYGKQVISDADILYEYNVMNPETIIRVSRLMLLARLILKAPQELMSIVRDMANLASGWTHAILDDLKWLCVSPEFETCLGFGFGQWENYVRDNPKQFKHKVKKFSRTRIANIPNPGLNKNIDPAPGSFACTSCDKQFSTFQELCLHQFKSHGARNVWRQYVGYHVHCAVCLKHFWTRERLINHLRYRSKICKQNMILRGPACDEATACIIDECQRQDNVDLYSKGRRRHFVEEPVVRLQGPMLPVILPEGIKLSKHHALGFGQNHN